MKFTELIPGLDYVANQVGLGKLDKGLIDSIHIRPEEIPANAQLTEKSNQLVTAGNQVKTLEAQIKSKTGQLPDIVQLKQQLAQIAGQRPQGTTAVEQRDLKVANLNRQLQDAEVRHAQAQTDIDQSQRMLDDLNQKVAQLQTDKKQLMDQLARDTRLALEHQLLQKVDGLWEKAQTSLQQGAALDHVVLGLAALRVVRQITNDIADVNQQASLSETGKQVYASLGQELHLATGRDLVASQYAVALSQPVALCADSRSSISSSGAASAQVRALKTIVGDPNWSVSIAQAAACAAAIQKCSESLSTIRTAQAGLTTGGDTRELFFPVTCEYLSEVLGAIKPDWDTWVTEAQAKIGMNLDELCKQFATIPDVHARAEALLVDAEAERKQLEITHTLGYALAALDPELKRCRARNEELRSMASDLDHSLPADVVTPRVKLAKAIYMRDQEVAALRTWMEENKSIVDSKYASAGAKRLAELTNPGVATWGKHVLDEAKQLSDDFETVDKTGQQTLKKLKAKADTAIENDDEYQRLKVQNTTGLTPEIVGKLETESAKPGNALGAVTTLFRNARSKEIERRKRHIDAIVAHLAKIVGAPSESASTVSVLNGLTLPALPEIKQGLFRR